MIKEGENPVQVIKLNSSGILSRAGPGKSCLNLAAPSAKAKYYWETDSEQVLWRKGEKYFEQKSEIEPETVRLQAVGVHIDGWRRAFCIMSLRVTESSEVNFFRKGTEAKASLNRALLS